MSADLRRGLNYSERQINRLLTTELGAGPLALARAQRAQTARTLIETTSMPITQIAFAAGFASVRQFNDTIREVFASSPTDLRGSRQPSAAGGTLSLRLPYRAPFHTESIFGFLGDRAVPGLETWDGTTYRRSLRLNHGNAVIGVSPGPSAPGANAVMCTLYLDNVADAQAAVQRCRRMLDLDADPDTVETHFADDPILGPLVRKRPGLRSPGHPDGVELLTTRRPRPAGVGQGRTHARSANGRVDRRSAGRAGRRGHPCLPVGRGDCRLHDE